jgi:hypothetical protein
MDKDELIKLLDGDASSSDSENDRKSPPGPMNSEAMRQAVERVDGKRPASQRQMGTGKEKSKRVTPKMRVFASSLSQGCSPREAYRKAYDADNSADSTVMAAANRLMKDERISALMGSVWEAVAENIVSDQVATRRYVMEQLHHHAESAKQENAKLKALELMGKAVGMFVDRVEQQVEQVSTEQLKKELRSHLTLLDNVLPVPKRSA